MKNKGSKKHKKRSQKQNKEKQPHGAKCKVEGHSTDTNNPDLLQADKTSKKNAMGNAIKENMKAVRKSNE